MPRLRLQKMNGIICRAFRLGWVLLLIILAQACRHHETRKVIFFRDFDHYSNFVATVDVLEFFDVPDMNFTNNPPKFIHACIIGLRKTDGELLCIGDPNFEAQSTGDFGRTLRVNQTYEFPKAWKAYKANHKKSGSQ